MRRLLSALVLLTACSEPPPAGEDRAEAGTSGGSGEDPSSSGEPEARGSSSGSLDDSSGGNGGDSGESSGGESSGGEGVEGPIEGRECPPHNGLTADNFGMPFVLTWCAGCHHSELTGSSRAGAPVGVDFDGLAEVGLFLPRIYARAGDAHDEMPPAGGPTPGDRMLLGDWLACGAPE